MDRLWMWVGFNAAVLAVLALDLGVFHRTSHRVSLREAAAWSTIWVALSLAFGYWVSVFMGRPAGFQFLTGYLIEKALSVDNIFVFVLIFSYFRVADEYQHRVLFWGILSALVMRGAMIAGGAYLIERFHWIMYVFGAFLAFTGIRLATRKGHEVHPDKNPMLRLVRRAIPVTSEYYGPRFFVRLTPAGTAAPRLTATPLFVVLVLVESTDLLFALDSIPAIFAVTTDPFIVYTSNVCAILGLRSLYFLLAGVVEKFHYLQLGLSVVLVFVGAKMLLADIYDVPIAASLAIIAAVLACAVAGSLLFPQQSERD
ncbi:MAG TPA: TerC family protein [Vicinamibacterales bacterium]|nr:TerC family protein [Vicinamibacterales bacterium]